MAEKYVTQVATVATGTDKTLLNIFHQATTPTSRGGLVEIIVGGAGTPGDNQATFYVGRTTAVGTEGSGLVPNNVDPAGPAGDCDSGLGVFGAEPTYTAAKQLLMFALNHRATFRWVAREGYELMMSATDDNGAGIKSATSTSTQAYSACIMFIE